MSEQPGDVGKQDERAKEEQQHEPGLQPDPASDDEIALRSNTRLSPDVVEAQTPFGGDAVQDQEPVREGQSRPPPAQRYAEDDRPAQEQRYGDEPRRQ